MAGRQELGCHYRSKLEEIPGPPKLKALASLLFNCIGCISPLERHYHPHASYKMLFIMRISYVLGTVLNTKKAPSH